MAWNTIGQSNRGNSGSSDLVQIENGKRVRLLLAESGGEPVSHWSYAISAPDDGYRTWISPQQGENFFEMAQAFRLRPVHAALAWDYEEKGVRILEAGNQIWEDIKKLHDVGKDLTGRDIIIHKQGSGRSTEYSVTDADPTPFQLPAGTELPDLNARYQPPTYDGVLEDLKQMGFTNPVELFTPVHISYEEAAAKKVPFGKYKDKTIGEVFQLDSTYLAFLSTKIDRVDIKECARVVSNQLLGTAYEVKGLTPLANAVTFVAPQANAGNAGGGMQRPTDPTHIHTNPDGTEQWWNGAEWVLQTPVPTPPAQPAGPTRPTDPTHIFTNPDGTEQWWINGAWVQQ